MKKNISINISGIIFHIEEDGYETLRKYLDSINRYFSTFEDSSEILADIEGRIAEIFLSKLSDGKQIITAEDVNSLMSTMGSVSDFKAAEEQEATADTSSKGEQQKESYTYSSASTSSSAHKKLYRDERRKIMGGVCAGLAHYFNIDPVWPRLLFALLVLGSYGGLLLVYIILWIALPVSRDLEEEQSIKKMFRDPERKVVGGVAAGVAAFFGIDLTLVRILFVVFTFVGGLGFLVYIILWIALPEAKSITEKMQMQGEPVTLSNIESTVKKGLNEKDNENESTLATIILFPFRLIATILTGIAKALGPLFTMLIEVLRVAIGIIITFTGLALLISLVVTAGILFGMISMDVVPGWWNIHVTELSLPLEAMRNSFPFWTVLFAFIVALIPTLAITLIGSSIIAKKVIFNPLIGWSMFVLFFVGLIFLSFKVPQIAYSFKEDGEYEVEETYPLDGKTPVFQLRETGLDDYDVTSIRILGQDEKNLRVVKHFEAQGNTRKIAGENAQMVTYTITRNDSVYTFDSNIAFKPEAVFRAQRLDIDLYVPYNQPFVMDEDLWRIVDNYGGRYDYRDYHSRNTWIMTDGGLQCTSCASYHRSESLPIRDQYGLSGFNAIELSGIFDIHIEEGDNYSVELNGASDQKKRYDIYLDHETLVIDYDDKRNYFWKKNFVTDDEIKMTIVMPHLKDLDVRGAGKLHFRGFDEEDMDIKLLGAVVADGKVHARNLNIDMTGASFLDLDGSGDFMEANITGACGLRAYNFESSHAIIEAHGASTAKVNVSQTLEIKKGFASNVSHRGDAEVIRRN